MAAKPDKDKKKEEKGEGSMATAPTAPLWFRIVTRTSAFIILSLGVGIWLVFLPWKVWKEWSLFNETKIGGNTFTEFLSYRFNYWVSKEGAIAMSTIIMIGCLTEVTAGALLYWATTGNSPFEGLWLVFLWMSASSVEGKVSSAEKIIGALATVGGLLLLALLLGTVTDYLAARIEKSKAGRDPVVEGGHTLVLGYSSIVGHLLKEIVEGSGDKSTIVVLGDSKKEEIEADLANQHISSAPGWKNVRLVLRTGQMDSPEDLARVCAATASRIVIPPDATMCREEADAQTFGILLTLSNHKLPRNGHVAAQCSVARNMPTMHKLHQNLYLLSGERLGVMMTQSSRDHGLCQVFTQLIGFDGDEFYFFNAKDYGVAGKTFQELAFCFPASIPLGLHKPDTEEIVLNPDRNLVLKEDDEVVLLQEDGDSSDPFTECYFDRENFMKGRPCDVQFCEENPNDQEVVRCLICNFQEQGCSISILFGLEDMCAEGSEVVLYTTLTEQRCKEVIHQAQQGEGREIKNFKITIYHTGPKVMTAAYQIDDLMKKEFDHIFVLADYGKSNADQVRVDQKTVATILQMKEVTERRNYSKFDPVVEVCSGTAEDQLKSSGVDNIVNTNLIMQKALAMVTVNKGHYGVLADLLSSEGNCFDLQELKSYLSKDEAVPTSLNFAEATAIVQRGARQVLVGWTVGSEYVINPKDKLESREWSMEDDKLLVIKEAD